MSKLLWRCVRVRRVGRSGNLTYLISNWQPTCPAPSILCMIRIRSSGGGRRVRGVPSLLLIVGHAFGMFITLEYCIFGLSWVYGGCVPTDVPGIGSTRLWLPGRLLVRLALGNLGPCWSLLVTVGFDGWSALSLDLFGVLVSYWARAPSFRLGLGSARVWSWWGVYSLLMWLLHSNSGDPGTHSVSLCSALLGPVEIKISYCLDYGFSTRYVDGWCVPWVCGLLVWVLEPHHGLSKWLGCRPLVVQSCSGLVFWSAPWIQWNIRSYGYLDWTMAMVRMLHYSIIRCTYPFSRESGLSFGRCRPSGSSTLGWRTLDWLSCLTLYGRSPICMGFTACC